MSTIGENSVPVSFGPTEILWVKLSDSTKNFSNVVEMIHLYNSTSDTCPIIFALILAVKWPEFGQKLSANSTNT